MPPKGHALLPASSSDRWLHYPPSARLCETYKDRGNDYTVEGTDTHALCEYKLRRALGMKAIDPTKTLDWYNTEMEDCATGYASFIMELLREAKQTCSDPVVLIERRVDPPVGQNKTSEPQTVLLLQIEHSEYATIEIEPVVLFLQIKIHNFPATLLAFWSFSMIFMTLIWSA